MKTDRGVYRIIDIGGGKVRVLLTRDGEGVRCLAADNQDVPGLPWAPLPEEYRASVGRGLTEAEAVGDYVAGVRAGQRGA